MQLFLVLYARLIECSPFVEIFYLNFCACQYTYGTKSYDRIDYCDSLYCHPSELVQKCLGDNIVISDEHGELVFEIRQNVGVVKFFNNDEYWYLVE